MTPLLPGLLADVLAHPHEDGPRLVSADWWEEHGEPERAEFIRVQCRLAAPILVTKADLSAETWPGEAAATAAERERPRREALRRRERELLRGPRPELYEHEVIWFNEGDGTETWRILFRPQWRRGFVHSLTATAADFLRHADAIRAQHPILAVALTTLPTVAQTADLARFEDAGIAFTLPPTAADFQHITGDDVVTYLTTAYDAAGNEVPHAP